MPRPLHPSAAFASHLLAALLLFASAATCGAASPDKTTPQQLTYRIIEEQSHIPNSFTQGWQLAQDNNSFFESSGLFGRSYIIQYDKNNKPLQRKQLPTKIFAEGLTEIDRKLYVLSWQAQTAYVFDSQDFSLLTQHSYRGEGWGLTHNQKELIMSNGSNVLTFIEPSTFKTKRTITVKDNSQKHWSKLNELEFANGLIWANIWQEPTILAINPNTGNIEGLLDLTPLVQANTRNPSHETLNGIAYDAHSEAYWITGKLWKKRYLIKIEQP